VAICRTHKLVALTSPRQTFRRGQTVPLPWRASIEKSHAFVRRSKFSRIPLPAGRSGIRENSVPDQRLRLRLGQRKE
jgi:hypothetical protein